MTINNLMEKDYIKIEQKNFLLINSPQSELVKELFKRVYMLNYMSNKIEFTNQFSTEFFLISRSCLIEAFTLFSQNYLRAAALVLRSGIENYLKHLLSINNLEVNSRVYIENKNTLEEFIKQTISVSCRQNSLLKLNEKLYSAYKLLSGLSHSLTKESKALRIDFVSEILSISEKNINKVFSIFNSVLDIMIMISIDNVKDSLHHWNREDITDLLSLSVGNKRMNRLLRIIKSGEDLEFYY